MAKVPRVSVITPVYNAERYVEAAVRSILAQTFTDFEYIIVDDASGDGSSAILQRLAAEDGRIRLYAQPSNSGLAAATNRAVAETRGDILVLMDADDMSHPERLARQVAYLDANPDVGLVAAQYMKIDGDGRVLRKARNNLGNAALKFHLLFGVPVCNPSIAFRRDVLGGLPMYDTGLMAATDYDFMLQIARRGWRMHVLPDYLFSYRINPAGISKQRKEVLLAEVAERALPYLRETLPEVIVASDGLALAIRVQGAANINLDARILDVYLRVVETLRRNFVARLSVADRRAVNAFAAEMVAKTLLGRYRIYRRPALLAVWLLSPAGQLRFWPLVAWREIAAPMLACLRRTVSRCSRART